MFPLACLNSMQVWSWARLFIQSVFLIGLLVHNNWYITDPLLKHRCIWKCSDTSWWSLIEMFTPIWQHNSFFFSHKMIKTKWLDGIFDINFPLSKKKKISCSFEMHLWVLYVWRKQLFFSEPSEWVSSLSRKLNQELFLSFLTNIFFLECMSSENWPIVSTSSVCLLIEYKEKLLKDKFILNLKISYLLRTELH